MLQVRGDADLGEDAFSAEYRAELRCKQLQRHRPVMTHVFGAIDPGHAAPADDLAEYVPIGNVLLQLFLDRRPLGRNVHRDPRIFTTSRTSLPFDRANV